MYSFLIVFHSLFRWLVLASLLLALFIAYKGWLTKQKYSKSDNVIKLVAVTVFHVQLIIGIILYFISPVVKDLLANFKQAIQQDENRFFGLEHSLMMLVSVVIITIGSAKAKRKTTDLNKFKTIAIWFTIGLLIILIFTPWSFSSLVSRPNFRPF